MILIPSQDHQPCLEPVQHLLKQGAIVHVFHGHHLHSFETKQSLFPTFSNGGPLEAQEVAVGNTIWITPRQTKTSFPKVFGRNMSVWTTLHYTTLQWTKLKISGPSNTHPTARFKIYWTTGSKTHHASFPWQSRCVGSSPHWMNCTVSILKRGTPVQWVGLSSLAVSSPCTASLRLPWSVPSRLLVVPPPPLQSCRAANEFQCQHWLHCWCNPHYSCRDR